MSRRFLPAAAILAFPVALAATPPTFEVATVKLSPPAESGPITINVGTYQNGKLTFGNASLVDCLKFAYGIGSDAQLAGPDWIWSKAVRFDIVAVTSPGTTREQAQLMLQPLLTERLKVALHREQRELPYLALVTGEKGPKMAVSKVKALGAGRSSGVRGHVHGEQISMQLLATLLSRFEGQTIVDRTGLGKFYDLELDWTPDNGTKPPADSPYPSLYTAVREQLGLRLESRKGPLDVLVVDHAEKTPTDN